MQGKEIGDKGVTPEFPPSCAHCMAVPENKMKFV